LLRAAEFRRDRGGGQRVGHVVAAGQPQPDVGAAGGHGHAERGVAEVVQADVGGQDVGVGAEAERHHPGAGPLGHRGHVGVVGVQDRHAAGGQRLD
jgi:hypothetical protein